MLAVVARSFVVVTVLIAVRSRCLAQPNLLLNGGFEDVNTCTEYQAECGVEGWFYLKDVKAQMLANETNTRLLGNNSFGIFYNWRDYTGFSPMIGTILPCGLQKGHHYTFTGLIAAKLNPRLILETGICAGPRFYVPGRPFIGTMTPKVITEMTPVSGTNFYSFRYTFIADGTEAYLTFGTFIHEDTVGARKKLVGTQTVSVVLDQFKLTPDDPLESLCADYAPNKQLVYDYNFRHKEMDYSLFGKGQLAIIFSDSADHFLTRQVQPAPPQPVPDTLLLTDVLFDFNKARLKPGAIEMLSQFFITGKNSQSIDSLYIEGHTDSIGTDARNMQLSSERSESIRKWLLDNKILSNEQIQVHPFGKTKPVAPNTTPEGRARNRRVELIIFRQKHASPG